eukprot:Nk52_evm83s485 gene=Nk52_evmTU83s485
MPYYDTRVSPDSQPGNVKGESLNYFLPSFYPNVQIPNYDQQQGVSDFQQQAADFNGIGGNSSAGNDFSIVNSASFSGVNPQYMNSIGTNIPPFLSQTGPRYSSASTPIPKASVMGPEVKDELQRSGSFGSFTESRENTPSPGELLADIENRIQATQSVHFVKTGQYLINIQLKNLHKDHSCIEDYVNAKHPHIFHFRGRQARNYMLAARVAKHLPDDLPKPHQLSLYMTLGKTKQRHRSKIWRIVCQRVEDEYVNLDDALIRTVAQEVQEMEDKEEENGNSEAASPKEAKKSSVSPRVIDEQPAKRKASAISAETSIPIHDTFISSACALEFFTFCQLDPLMHILDPRAGDGALLEPVLRANPFMKVLAFESSAERVADLKGKFSADKYPNVRIFRGDFVSMNVHEYLQAGEHIDAILTNPPIDTDADFLFKCTCICPQVFTFLTVDALAVSARYEKLLRLTKFDRLGMLREQPTIVANYTHKFRQGSTGQKLAADNVSEASKKFCIVEMKPREAQICPQPGRANSVKVVM